MISDEQLEEWEKEATKAIDFSSDILCENMQATEIDSLKVAMQFNQDAVKIGKLIEALRAERKCNAVLREALNKIKVRLPEHPNSCLSAIEAALAKEAEIRSEG